MMINTVTGTVGNFGFYNGESYITTEETEPLGQTLRQNAPAEPPQPLPNDPNIGSADYPQWQCTAGEQFYGSFSAMPFHCQKAMLQDFSKGLDEIFGFSNPNRPANPTRISIRSIGGLDSPLRLPSIPYMDSSGGKSPNNLALAKMLQITAKPKIEDEQQVVAKVNVPISFDDSLIDFSDTGVVEANVSGNDNKKLVDRAIDDVIDIFGSDNDCSRFFEQSVKIATIYSTENGKSTVENVYVPQYDATPAATVLGEQLRNNIGLLPGRKSGNTTIGIEMSNKKNGGVIFSQEDGLRFEKFDSAIVNIRGPFLSSGKFGNYSGRAGRALAILHEIAHLIRREGSSALIVPDDGEINPTKSMKNTEIIEAKCKKELDALK